VKGVDTESGLITAEFLKSILEKESDSEKKHEIICKVVELLRYFKSDDAFEDVMGFITDIKQEALAQIANNVKDKESLYYMMEFLKKKGKLMNKAMISHLKHDIVNIVLYGMSDALELGKLKPRLVESHDAAKILGCLTYHEATEILNHEPELATEILKCMKDQQKYAIGDMMEDIRLAEKLNKIGASNTWRLKEVFKESRRVMTVMLFEHLYDNVAGVMINRFFNGEKSVLITLSNSMAMSMPEPNEANTAYMNHVQEIINKVWRVYVGNSIYDLLLSMSNKEIKNVLKR
jgi:hypothetical protein